MKRYLLKFKHQTIINRINYLILIFILSFLFLNLNSNVKAQTVSNKSSSDSSLIRVSPVILSPILSPGKNYTYQITVENLSPNPLPLMVETANLEINQDEDETTTTPSLSSWLIIKPENLIISGNSQEQIELTLSIPSHVPIGGYYGMVNLTPLIAVNPKIPTPQIIPRVGVLILGSVGVAPDLASKRAQITGFIFDKWLYEQGPANLDLKIKNIALHHFSAKPILEITPIGQKSLINRFILGEKIILPGRSRTFTDKINLPDRPAGIYNAKLRLSTGGGAEITTNKYIIVFPLSKTLAVLIPILLIYIFIKYRKRIILALKAFVS